MTKTNTQLFLDRTERVIDFFLYIWWYFYVNYVGILFDNPTFSVRDVPHNHGPYWTHSKDIVRYALHEMLPIKRRIDPLKSTSTLKQL